MCGWLLYKLIYSNTKLKINIQETKRSRNRTDSTTDESGFEWATTRQKKAKSHQHYKQKKNEANPLHDRFEMVIIRTLVGIIERRTAQLTQAPPVS